MDGPAPWHCPKAMGPGTGGQRSTRRRSVFLVGAPGATIALGYWREFSSPNSASAWGFIRDQAASFGPHLSSDLEQARSYLTRGAKHGDLFFSGRMTDGGPLRGSLRFSPRNSSGYRSAPWRVPRPADPSIVRPGTRSAASDLTTEPSLPRVRFVIAPWWIRCRHARRLSATTSPTPWPEFSAI